jgi:hypothetical protein
MMSLVLCWENKPLDNVIGPSQFGPIRSPGSIAVHAKVGLHKQATAVKRQRNQWRVTRCDPVEAVSAAGAASFFWFQAHNLASGENAGGN